jgi:hypothetical protein
MGCAVQAIFPRSSKMGTSLYPPRVRAHFEAYAETHRLPPHQRPLGLSFTAAPPL